MSDAGSTPLSELSDAALAAKAKWYAARGARFADRLSEVEFEQQARRDADEDFPDDSGAPTGGHRIEASDDPRFPLPFLDPDFDACDIADLGGVLPPDLDLSAFAVVVLAVRPNRTVVKQSYKAKYKAQGDARSCGDWLAKTLAKHVNDEERKLIVPEFERILSANGIAHEHWNRTTAGWQGRLRMTGRMALARKVVEEGALLLGDGARIEAPLDWQMAHGA